MHCTSTCFPHNSAEQLPVPVWPCGRRGRLRFPSQAVVVHCIYCTMRAHYACSLG